MTRSGLSTFVFHRSTKSNSLSIGIDSTEHKKNLALDE